MASKLSASVMSKHGGILSGSVRRTLRQSWNFRVQVSVALLNTLPDKCDSHINFKKLHEDADAAIRAMLSPRKRLNGADWDNLAVEYRTHLPDTKLNVIDFRVLGLCREWGNLAAARALMQYRRASKAAIPLPTLALYLEIVGCCGKEDAGADAEVLELHRQLSDVPLDGRSASRVVHGLCSTRHWRLALDYIVKARQSGGKPVEALSFFAAAAFRNGDALLGWQLMQELADDLMRPSDDAFDAWLSQCEARARLESRARLSGSATGVAAPRSVEPTGAPAADMIQTLLRFLQHSDLLLTDRQARRLKQLTDDRLVQRWTTAATQLTGSGRCEHCRLVLPEAVLSDEDFEEVRNEFVQHGLIGEDVFQRSTPEEVERYRRFVAQTAPYDVVVDGLNVSIAVKRHKSAKPVNSALFDVVNHFAVQKGQKVLVIGRYHMKGWNKRDLVFVKRNALLFTTDNMSSDDAFLLYAVMHSHKRTRFVTRDFFRDHGARLPDAARVKFQQLVRANRIHVNGAAHGTVSFTMPPRHFMRAQEDPLGGWHVPYMEKPPGLVIRRNAAVEDTDRWLCMRPSPTS